MNTITTQKHKMNEDEVITVDNVKHLGEWAAIQVLKSNLEKYGCPFLRKTYGLLIRDVYNFDTPGYTLTDAYDAAQEAIVFLCGHIGRKLNDTVTDGKGKQIEICIACFRVVNVYVQRNQRKARKNQYIDDLPYQIPVAFEWDTEAEQEAEYTAVDGKIAAMDLTERQAEALSCRVSGLSMKGTARALSLTIKPVYQLMHKVRAKYLQTFGGMQI